MCASCANTQEWIEVNKSLPQKYNSYQMQINGRLYRMPLRYSIIKKAGFYGALDYNQKLKIEPNNLTTNYINCYSETKKSYIKIGMWNDNKEPTRLEDCKICGIEVEKEKIKDDSIEIVFPGGVQIGMPIDKAIKEYGECTDKNSVDSENTEIYSWEDNDQNFVRLYVDKSNKRIIKMAMQHT